jgi:hypothetical protein
MVAVTGGRLDDQPSHKRDAMSDPFVDGFNLGRRAGFLEKTCESPIEEEMARAICFEAYRRDVGVRVQSQSVIGNYRADFIIELDDIKIVIECDGHDYHERTKEQAARDRKNARARHLTF